jgi:hypothetical protein
MPIAVVARGILLLLRTSCSAFLVIVGVMRLVVRARRNLGGLGRARGGINAAAALRRSHKCESEKV